MNSLTQPPPNTSASAELAPLVAQLSMVFARLFGQKWRDQGSDPKTLRTWERAFAHAGLREEDIRRGMAAASGLPWPPSCGEFVALCREPVPSLEAAMAEAARWAHGVETHDGTWSHPAVGAAARKVGDFALRNHDQRSLARRFESAYRDTVAAHHRGEELDLPLKRLAHDPKPGPQTAEQVQRSLATIAELRRHFGQGHAA